VIRSIRPKGTGFSIAFGTTKCVDRSDGLFPVEIWRVHVREDDTREEEHKRTCTKPGTLEQGKAIAGAGWRSGAVRSWVELRTPAIRAATQAGAAR
jgi:hypothetical protein